MCTFCTVRHPCQVIVYFTSNAQKKKNADNATADPEQKKKCWCFLFAHPLRTKNSANACIVRSSNYHGLVENVAVLIATIEYTEEHFWRIAWWNFAQRDALQLIFIAQCTFSQSASPICTTACGQRTLHEAYLIICFSVCYEYRWCSPSSTQWRPYLAFKMCTSMPLSGHSCVIPCPNWMAGTGDLSKGIC